MKSQCDPWAGVLLYGPPGNGKTFFSKAIANEINFQCFLFKFSWTISWRFRINGCFLYQLAKEKRPSVIFIYEIDGISSKRKDSDSDVGRKVQCEMLKNMTDSVRDDVYWVGATNCPWVLDEAIF